MAKWSANWNSEDDFDLYGSLDDAIILDVGMKENKFGLGMYADNESAAKFSSLFPFLD